MPGDPSRHGTCAFTRTGHLHGLLILILHIIILTKFDSSIVAVHLANQALPSAEAKATGRVKRSQLS